MKDCFGQYGKWKEECSKHCYDNQRCYIQTFPDSAHAQRLVQKRERKRMEKKHQRDTEFQEIFRNAPIIDKTEKQGQDKEQKKPRVRDLIREGMEGIK